MRSSNPKAVSEETSRSLTFVEIINKSFSYGDHRLEAVEVADPTLMYFKLVIRCKTCTSSTTAEIPVSLYELDLWGQSVKLAQFFMDSVDQDCKTMVKIHSVARIQEE